MSNNLPNVEGMSLDNPHVDKAINAGTTAANCQPRHTRESLSVDDNSLSDDSTIGGESSTNTGKKLSRAERKSFKKEQKAAAARRKRDQEDPKKMGYIQMAKMGYQELVNAIIRPPRAEYKVSSEKFLNKCSYYSFLFDPAHFLFFSNCLFCRRRLLDHQHFYFAESASHAQISL
jgi:hypothetical protein